jgi:hypothetical protein
MRTKPGGRLRQPLVGLPIRKLLVDHRVTPEGEEPIEPRRLG